MEINPYYHSWKKRFFDIFISLFLFLLISPILIIISLIIAITAGFPIIYKQKRTGKNKNIFIIYKFRVMYLGAEKNQWRYRKDNQAPAPMYKNWNDPRFVGIGKWLSRTGLDEIPQLLNVLKGEMSLIGPRPLPLSETEKLDAKWNFRYEVKPGIFSDWSASKKGKITLKEWQDLEKNTLKKGGFNYEIQIVLETLKIILKRIN